MFASFFVSAWAVQLKNDQLTHRKCRHFSMLCISFHLGFSVDLLLSHGDWTAWPASLRRWWWQHVGWRWTGSIQEPEKVPSISGHLEPQQFETWIDMRNARIDNRVWTWNEIQEHPLFMKDIPSDPRDIENYPMLFLGQEMRGGFHAVCENSIIVIV